MKQSIVIELAGRFVGVAIADDVAGYGFVAVDERLRNLDAHRWASLHSLRIAARGMLLTGSGPAPAATHQQPPA